MPIKPITGVSLVPPAKLAKTVEIPFREHAC